MLENTSSQVDFHELGRRAVSILKRYWRVSAPVSVLVLWGAVYFVLQIPAYYQTDFTFSLSPQSVTSKLLPKEKAEQDTKRLDVLVQETLSRPRLLNIIEKLELYPELTGIKRQEMALAKLQASITISPVSSDLGRKVENAVTVSVTHGDRKQTFEIAKLISNIFLEESVSRLRGEARATKEFFNGELRAARSRLDRIDQQISQFVATNYGKLPEHLGLELTRLQISGEEILADEEITKALAQVPAPKSIASSSLASSSVYSLPGINGMSMQETRADLSQKLGMLRMRYSEKHPDVMAMQKRLAWLDAQIATQPKRARSKTRSRSKAASNVSSISVVDQKELKKSRDQRKSEVSTVLENIRTMPQMQQQLEKMQRDYQLVVENYQRILLARQDAQLQESLFNRWYSSRFKLLEPPIEPISAAGPARTPLMAGAGAVSLVVFLAIPFGMFFLNGGYQFRSQLEKETGIPVIGMVLSVDTSERKLRREGGVMVSVGAAGSVVGMAIGMVFITLGIL